MEKPQKKAFANVHDVEVHVFIEENNSEKISILICNPNYFVLNCKLKQHDSDSLPRGIKEIIGISLFKKSSMLP